MLAMSSETYKKNKTLCNFLLYLLGVKQIQANSEYIFASDRDSILSEK